MDTLPMLLGATLVSGGVLASALADRIRGLRSTTLVSRQRQAAESQSAAERTESQAPRAKRSLSVGAGTPARGIAPMTITATGSEDIVDMLVGSGYKPAIAKKAVAACTAHEQASPESWAVAALRRAAGGAS